MIKIIAFLFFLELFQFSNCDDRIVNGEDAKLGQFPHQVLWARDSYLPPRVFCGGSIYSKSTIITAAHCCKAINDGVAQLEDMRIIAGRVDIYDIVNGEEISIKNYTIHPDYIGNSEQHNDVCLLTLNNDLEFNDNVKAIELNTANLAAGTKCTVSGWGGLKVNSSFASHIGYSL